MSAITDGTVAELQQLSDVVCRARETPQPAGANQVLRDALPLTAHPLGPLAALWAGDNLMMEMRFEEALEDFRTLRAQAPQPKAEGVPISVTAAQSEAACHRARGRRDHAVKRLMDAADEHPSSVALGSLLLGAGELAEEAGNSQLAQQLYARAAQVRPVSGHDGFSVGELAARAAKRLGQAKPAHTFVTAEALALRLAELLSDRDANAIAALASPTHFTLGFAGSERHFIDFGSIAAEFRADLALSDLRADPIALQGHGGKLYMATEHWAGRTLVGRVYFVLTRFGGGWEWSGLACTALPDELVAKLGRFEKATNQPLTIAIKAPWSSGRRLRAGGLTAWAVQQALLGLPFGLGFLIIHGLSLNPVGWGPNGFYYNQAETHRGMDAFAIDFTAYVPGLPYVDAAGNTPVLAAAAGLVTGVVSDRVTGDPVVDNRVVMVHPTSVDETRRALEELLDGRPINGCRYNSRSLHLAGPRLVRVSRGMFIRQGVTLGLIDDTGNSALNHLHFAMGDRDSSSGPFASVRPTPMSGQTLNDGEDGKVILSDNVVF